MPQAPIELEVDDVQAAAAELEAHGHTLIHPARSEPWDQTPQSPAGSSSA